MVLTEKGASESMRAKAESELVSIPTDGPIWASFFSVAPLVLVATKEADGRYDVAPKHMAMPLGWQNYFCFACAPRHATYANAVRHGNFTVSYPRPSQVVQASITAAGRTEEGRKPGVEILPTFPASRIDGVLVEGCAVFLECALERAVDGFGDNSLVVGKVLAAQADPAFLRGSERDDGDLLREAPLLAYLSPGRFASVGDSLSFPFPADFRI
jgi:flavin reductase (DIM6/NTAB) family NADH-FMN oxidoreductase RutF